MAATLSSVLLVEDDDGDALLVRECLREAGIDEGKVVWRRTVTDGALAHALVRPSCVLLDLGLPDAHGLEALHAMTAVDAPAPVVVLTGRHGDTGNEAVAAGAQDFLVKDDITPDLLERTIRYAVERHHAQATELQLREERLLAAENDRLERGLLPRPLLRDGRVRCSSHYRAGRSQAVLGGDFYDVVELPDGRLRAVIGDVMGHGPDEAALGVSMRVAWRALVLAGVPDDQILVSLSRLLDAETDGGIFVTVLDLTLDPRDGLTLRVAGHPPPLVRDGLRARYVDALVGPPLGVSEGAERQELWPATTEHLAPGATLLLFTDGLLDSYRVESDTSSLGLDELLAVVAGAPVQGRSEAELADLVSRIVALAGTQAADDQALVALTTDPVTDAG